jgi:hypothetical protein
MRTGSSETTLKWFGISTNRRRSCTQDSAAFKVGHNDDVAHHDAKAPRAFEHSATIAIYEIDLASEKNSPYGDRYHSWLP